MKIKNFRESELIYIALKNFYQSEILKINNRAEASRKLGKSETYIDMILKRDNFSALRRLCIELSELDRDKK